MYIHTKSKQSTYVTEGGGWSGGERQKLRPVFEAYSSHGLVVYILAADMCSGGGGVELGSFPTLTRGEKIWIKQRLASDWPGFYCINRKVLANKFIT